MRRPRIIRKKTCPVCGIVFVMKPHSPQTQTCSRKCGGVITKAKLLSKRRLASQLSSEDLMARVKLLFWLKRVAEKYQGDKPDIDYHRLVDAWQVIREIPLVVEG